MDRKPITAISVVLGLLALGLGLGLGVAWSQDAPASSDKLVSYGHFGSVESGGPDGSFALTAHFSRRGSRWVLCFEAETPKRGRFIAAALLIAEPEIKGPGYQYSTKSRSKSDQDAMLWTGRLTPGKGPEIAIELRYDKKTGAESLSIGGKERDLSAGRVFRLAPKASIEQLKAELPKPKGEEGNAASLKLCEAALKALKNDHPELAAFLD